MAEERANPFDAEREKNSAMRPSSRRLGKEPDAQPVQSEQSKLMATPLGDSAGQEALARVNMLNGLVQSLLARVDELEDDFPEQENGVGGGAASGAWSGFVWYLGDLKWDFSKVDADPDGEALEGVLGAALEGIYLVIELETGDFQWADSVSGIEGVSASTHSLFPVCARSGSGTEEDPYTYALSSNRVVGDIRIEAVPYLPVAEAEET